MREKRFIFGMDEKIVKNAKKKIKEHHLKTTALGKYFEYASEMIPDLIDAGINPVVWMKKQRDLLFKNPQGQLEMFEKEIEKEIEKRKLRV